LCTEVHGVTPFRCKTRCKTRAVLSRLRSHSPSCETCGLLTLLT
jgi:hypothetical protein